MIRRDYVEILMNDCCDFNIMIVILFYFHSRQFAGKSDPYVKMKLGREQVMKTDTKKRTLKPRYDETFDLLVYERSVEVMVLLLS